MMNTVEGFFGGGGNYWTGDCRQIAGCWNIVEVALRHCCDHLLRVDHYSLHGPLPQHDEGQ